MGITLTALSDGTVMDASVVTARFTTIQTWQNGGIIDTDVTDDSVLGTSILRMEHYALHGRRSKAPTGTTSGYTVTTDPTRRTYANVDSHGKNEWNDVGVLSRQVYADDAGTVEVCFEWWCWSIGGSSASLQNSPEGLKAGDFRLVVSGTACASTVIPVYSAGYDTTVTDGGQFVYPARNLQAITSRSVIAGWVTAVVQYRVASLGTGVTNRDGYTNCIIGARNLHLEVWTK